MALKLSCDLDFTFDIGRKHVLYRFTAGNRAFMQDIGGKGDTDSSRRTQHSDGGSCVSNPLDTVSLLEIGCFFPAKVHEKLRTQVILLPVRTRYQRAVGPWSFAEALNHSTGPGESLRRLCPKKL
jgi:hypothetical protein